MKFSCNLLLTALAVATTTAFVPSNLHHGQRSLSFVSPSVKPFESFSSTAIKVLKNPLANDSATLSADEQQVRALFTKWNDALATLDSTKVASLYATDGFLLPTVSDVPRADFDSIKDYFDNFLQLKPQGTILEGKIKIGDTWAEDCGIYEFEMGATGAKVKARYTFVYKLQDGEWKISHHHSSAMPEQMMAKGEELEDDQVRDLFQLWNSALATLDPETVAKRYSSQPVLLPTVSDTPRTDFASIQDYFVNFLKLKPQGEILESYVTKGPNWCKDVGVYEFTMGADGSKVKARYSFVYVYEDGEWKIAHHHSSMMPESVVAKKEVITPEETKELFYLWNDALATLDSDQVTKRYAKNAVLLPTVSDTPRTDAASIKDYFDNFLKLKPQGEIVESYTECGDGWCKDVGVYEFTMGSDGSKVKARYSFVYVFEDGEWKISHHHSSAMPEGLGPKGETISEDEARALFGRWNSALATLDPEAVAKRYSKNPILLPTVSDTPRTDFDSIKDYFVNFLELKPQGEILESHVTTGPNWAKDAGIYEFTMGKDGSKVKARYSFVYVFEDGEWKIAHHHSSVMPEGNVSKKDVITDEEAKELFYLWNDALATLDSEKVASRYAKNAVLLPTVSDTPRTDKASIVDYFDNFLKLKPQGEIVESYTECGDGWCKDVGVYEFTMGANGSTVKARYSFVYVFEDGEWKISHHHSSAMPEGMTAKGEELSEDEVRGLFSLWNDALATLDPDTVAKRYSKKPVLLPTVSDIPRTDYDSIKDYFVNFLQLKPQGVILESHVTTGPNWAKDTGIYEFTTGIDGKKVKARYSFVYVFEDGEWKISHHHSSIMPESVLKKNVISDEEAKGLFYKWNDALATLDPEAVADRYASNAVLLPTVSDTPRTDRASIVDYFTNFLQLKPQGEIVESFTECGDGWCKDVGVYEFTMGANGSKVKARYSFVYVFEDGEWKISHHHSSAMPEGMTAKGEELADDEISALFGLWNDALATLDPDTVAKRYSKNPVLLPTVSDVPRTDYDSIKDYFVNFLKLKPQGVILESHLSSGPNWAKDVGIYEFTMGADGSKVKARYSFVYVYEDGEWKISHHHSSMMPEGSKKPTLSEDEAKSLFYLWNDALATLDSDTVAKRYAKNAVLLPTVSDDPRTDYGSIKDYFDSFLLKKPQGEIVESHAVCGEGWCKDVGVYEFTMGADGSKVKARYSFVYLYEDGEWKISHHHSSAMPEGLLSAADKLSKVEAILEELKAL